MQKQLPKIIPLSVSDFREGADRLHQLLDNKIIVRVPHNLKVFIFGALSAVLPVAAIYGFWIITK